MEDKLCYECVNRICVEMFSDIVHHKPRLIDRCLVLDVDIHNDKLDIDPVRCSHFSVNDSYCTTEHFKQWRNENTPDDGVLMNLTHNNYKNCCHELGLKPSKFILRLIDAEYFNKHPIS